MTEQRSINPTSQTARVLELVLQDPGARHYPSRIAPIVAGFWVSPRTVSDVFERLEFDHGWFERHEEREKGAGRRGRLVVYYVLKPHALPQIKHLVEQVHKMEQERAAILAQILLAPFTGRTTRDISAATGIDIRIISSHIQTLRGQGMLKTIQSGDKHQELNRYAFPTVEARDRARAFVTFVQNRT
jgi:hypothetical protein